MRWFHTGGNFVGLSDATVEVAEEAMAAGHRRGVTISYDPNYRPSLWADRGSADRARELIRYGACRKARSFLMNRIWTLS